MIMDDSIKNNYNITRERSFVRPHSQYQQQQQYIYHHQQVIRDKKNKNVQQLQAAAAAAAQQKTKPTMEIYRPPNIRTDTMLNGACGNNNNYPNPKLNVHAKEFTMKYGQIQPSRSSGNVLLTFDNNRFIQHSRSSGNILHTFHLPHHHHHHHHQQHMQVPATTAAAANTPSPRVHFRMQQNVDDNVELLRQQQQQYVQSKLNELNGNKIVDSRHNKIYVNNNAGDAQGKQVRFSSGGAVPPALQRSKSLGAADMLSKHGYKSVPDAPDLGTFPADVESAITKAVDDPNQLPARVLMELVRHVMERVLESRRYAEPAAKVCIKIIEKERKETFLESLLNTCQQWYQERDRVLRGSSPPKAPAFMAFLNEMYCQLKRRQLQLKTQQEGVPPGLVLLTLLCKCCHDCLKPPSVSSASEMESLFFVLTAIGKDLEQELPGQLNGLLNGVRDAFLTAQTAPAIRKTLLQLIELSAARWQLPAPAVMYYYPGTNK